MDSHQRWKIERVVIAVLILGAIFTTLYFLRYALIPIFIALGLAYILDPVVGKLENRFIGRQSAIFILAFASLIVLGGAVTFLAYQGQKEVVFLYHNLPQYLEEIHTKYGHLAHRYLGVRIPRSIDDLFDQTQNHVGKINPEGLKPVTGMLTDLTSKTLSLLSWAFALVLTPVFLFYFLRDWDEMKAKLVGYIPLAYRDYLVKKGEQIDDVLSGFIRGQLTVCLIMGILYAIGLSIVNINLAVVIGMLSGMAYIVPYLGTAIGLIAASIMSLLQHGLDWHIFAAWLVFGVVQALEGSIITPRVVGNKVGLSPVAVIAAILIAGDLLGFLGVLIAVPTAAVLNVFIKDALERYKQSRFFLEPPAIKIFSADFEVAPPKETQPAALEKTEEADE